jgi:hypothetical protein
MFDCRGFWRRKPIRRCVVGAYVIANPSVRTSFPARDNGARVGTCASTSATTIPSASPNCGSNAGAYPLVLVLVPVPVPLIGASTINRY